MSLHIASRIYQLTTVQRNHYKNMENIMKKLLIGLTLLVSMSSFANTFTYEEIGQMSQLEACEKVEFNELVEWNVLAYRNMQERYNVSLSSFDEKLHREDTVITLFALCRQM